MIRDLLPSQGKKLTSVLDDFLAAIVKKAVHIQDTMPEQCVTGFKGSPSPYEIVGAVDLLRCDQDLNLGADGSSHVNPAILWERYRDLLPQDHILLAFTIEGMANSVVLEVRKDADTADFTTYMKTSMGRWWAVAYGIRVAEGQTLPLAMSEHVSVPFRDLSGTVVQGSLMALFQMLHLMRDQAIEIEMGTSGPGQRRLNTKLNRRMPPMPRPRMLHLSKVKINRIPVVQPARLSPGFAVAAHDRRAHIRHYRAGRYVNVKGTTAPIKPAKIHGGSIKPRVTLVKMLD